MAEGEGVGTELEDSGGFVFSRWRVPAVEPVAEDGTAQAPGMGGVDTQLVGAAGVGREQNAEIRSFLPDKVIIGHRRFPIFVVDKLPWTV